MDEQWRLAGRVRYKQGPAGLDNGPLRSENKEGALERKAGSGLLRSSPRRGRKGVGKPQTQLPEVEAGRVVQRSHLWGCSSRSLGAGIFEQWGTLRVFSKGSTW